MHEVKGEELVGSQGTTSALSLLVTTFQAVGADRRGEVWGCLASSSSEAELGRTGHWG